ncbi:hypothetical protein EFL81_10200 [Weissella confusa]|uniref:hypothetical protein n=1 Tax=Weissella confusa TaxID=1583 RepID=UPI00223B69F1|nr:hypothetical protein [Weissella confusa]MCS9991192.1 hypothetical protein [Weissella confusa]MCS9997176.1 hypothetical protein [Weissella confusa]
MTLNINNVTVNEEPLTKTAKELILAVPNINAATDKELTQAFGKKFDDVSDLVDYFDSMEPAGYYTDEQLNSDPELDGQIADTYPIVTTNGYISLI